MRIQSIGDNNQQTTFTANVIVGGHTKDIPKAFISDWCKRGKSIGSNTDTVIINFGKEQTERVSKPLFGFIPRKITLRSRNITILSDIDGRAFDKNISYTKQRNGFSASAYIQNSVNSFMDELAKK